jgi:hypothetical protein
MTTTHPTGDFFAGLPPDDAMQAKLAKIARKYLPLIPGADPEAPIPDRETVLELMEWQQLEIEVLEANNAWLRKTKAAVERTGREWNRENFLRHCELRECE